MTLSEATLRLVPVNPFSLERLAPAVTERVYERLQIVGEQMRERYAGRVIWNISSTEKGGGVAEMLTQLLAYARGTGVDTRWVVIDGDAPFFALTKRIHNRLHGSPGDGGPLGREEAAVYEATLRANAEQLAKLLGPNDVVLLHDPQTLGLVPAIKELGPKVIWRCHIGVNEPNDLVREAWAFLLAYAQQADACVFSRRQFIWEGISANSVAIIAPGLDPAAPKNQELPGAAIDAILLRTGLLGGHSGNHLVPEFMRDDGTRSRVARQAILHSNAPPQIGDRLVVQISRWDRLKDHAGVMRAFAEHIAPYRDAHLMLVGPSVEAVADDPEGSEVYAECVAQHAQLAPAVQARVHLASLPMDDAQENAAIVNALQRRANIVVQKSLAEGFGLTVSEAMWKARPVVGSRVGGIEDQIVDGISGLLVEPRDLDSFAQAISSLLDDTGRAGAIGMNARERVRSEFLAPRQLLDHVALLTRVDPPPTA